MLPPPEKNPIVLVKWTEMAKKRPDLIEKVHALLTSRNLLLIPSGSPDITLLSATQENLEKQAQNGRLVKTRRISGPSSVQFIMDRFKIANRQEFCGVSSEGFDSKLQKLLYDGDVLFSVHERGHLVLGILEQISVDDPKFRAELSKDLEMRDATSNLRYLLQSHGWIENLTPVHQDDVKTRIQKDTWYPLFEMMPPVDEIQSYYGPQVAYYFAFMGFLGQWLSRLGILGFAIYMFRLYREDTIDEDEYTPFYGLFCFVWAVCLCQFWVMEESELAYRWGTLEILTTDAKLGAMKEDYDLDGGLYAHRRPEFVGQIRISPVTGLEEIYFPEYKRKLRYLASALVTILMLAIAFWVMILSLNLQGYIVPKYQYHPFYFRYVGELSLEGALFDSRSSYMSYGPSILHAVCIQGLNAIYRHVATKLTHMENHETQLAYDNSLILKRFLFEAFDCYIVLFYLAFYEKDVDRLREELVTIVNIDSFRKIAAGVLAPYVFRFFESKKSENDNRYGLHLEAYEPFDDFMETMIQFGYVTLFASAYPLASLLMAGAVWVDIRADIYKLTYLRQKPVSLELVHDIEVWKRILVSIMWTSCLTNCLLFGFTSNQLEYYMPHFYTRDANGITLGQDKSWIIVLIIFLLEHAMIMIGLVLQRFIPPMSEKLDNDLKRRIYLLSYQEHSKKKKE